jgi:hypothetical protein
MGRLIGGSSHERLITAGTALAIVIAIVAVIVLATGGSDDGDSAGSEGGDSQAPYAQEADRLCTNYKRAVAVAATRAARSEDDPGAALALFGGAAADLVAQWRARLAVLEPPPDRQEGANRLQLALARLEVVARNTSGQAKKSEDLRSLRARLAGYATRLQNAIEAAGLGACAKGDLGLEQLETS